MSKRKRIRVTSITVNDDGSRTLHAVPTIDTNAIAYGKASVTNDLLVLTDQKKERLFNAYAKQIESNNLQKFAAFKADKREARLQYRQAKKARNN